MGGFMYQPDWPIHNEGKDGSAVDFMALIMIDPATPSSEAHLGLFGGKKKSQNKNFDDHITTI
jgi:hypothetical protein